jgi:hypothetical protein
MYDKKVCTIIFYCWYSCNTMCYDLLNLQVTIPTTTRQRKDLEFTQNQHNSFRHGTYFPWHGHFSNLKICHLQVQNIQITNRNIPLCFLSMTFGIPRLNIQVQHQIFLQIQGIFNTVIHPVAFSSALKAEAWGMAINGFILHLKSLYFSECNCLSTYLPSNLIRTF